MSRHEVLVAMQAAKEMQKRQAFVQFSEFSGTHDAELKFRLGSWLKSGWLGLALLGLLELML